MRTWLPVEIGLAKHPKTRSLARLWSAHPYTVVGFLLELWGYCLEHQPNGDTGAIPDEDLNAMAAPCLAASIGLMADVRESLRRVGLVEKSGRLHDWNEYAGRIIQKRAAERKRMQCLRKERSKRTPNGTPNGLRHAASTYDAVVQHSTVQNNKGSSSSSAREGSSDDVRQALPDDARSIYDGYLRAARMPDAITASIRSLHDGLHAAHPWPVLGRALVAMAAANVSPYSEAALAGFAARIANGEKPKAGGALTRQQRNEAAINKWAADAEQGAA